MVFTTVLSIREVLVSNNLRVTTLSEFSHAFFPADFEAVFNTSKLKPF
jgi:hypothetical protein